MADSDSNTEFNNILQQLDGDLSTQITPALDQATESLQALLTQARERVSASAEEMRLVLDQTQAMCAQIRAELETFERLHTQASATSNTQLEATAAPFAQVTEQLLTSSTATSDAAVDLDEAFPALTEAVSETTANLAEAGNEMQAQIEDGSAKIDAVVETLTSGLAKATAVAEQSFTALSEGCATLTEQSNALAAALSERTAEHLTRSAEELRSGVHAAAQAAETASTLVLDGLEVFQGASEQLERVFGEDSEEIMGHVRQLVDLVESIKPFIEIAKSI